MTLVCKEFLTGAEAVSYLVHSFKCSAEIAVKKQGVFRVALSGGKTPVPFFKSIAHSLEVKQLDWSKVEFYWVDERWVPVSHSDNNFSVAHDHWLRYIAATRYPVNTQLSTPDSAASAYGKLLRDKLGLQGAFDWILVGAGSDGHTASIFEPPYETNEISIATRHPVTGQPRVSITLPVLAKSKKISLLLIGEDKRPLYERIKNSATLSPQLPIEFLIQISSVFEVVTDLHG